MQTQTGAPVRYYGDIYYILQQPIVLFHHPSVRQFTLHDLSLLEAVPQEVRGSGFGSTPALLSEGIVAAAIQEGSIVAVASTSAILANNVSLCKGEASGKLAVGDISSYSRLIAYENASIYSPS